MGAGQSESILYIVRLRSGFWKLKDIAKESNLCKDLKDQREKVLNKANYFQSLINSQSFFMKNLVSKVNRPFLTRYLETDMVFKK